MYNFKRKNKKLHMTKNRAKILRNTINNFKSKHVSFQEKESGLGSRSRTEPGVFVSLEPEPFEEKKQEPEPLKN